MRKLLLTLLGVLMALPMLARDFTYEYEGQTLTYTVIDEDAKTCGTKIGEIPVPGNEVSGDLKIPAIARDGDVEYSVTTIGSFSFFDCGSMTSVEIPSTVTTIGDYAFYGCSGLSSIVIPASVATIDDADSVFRNCSSLTQITVEEDNANYCSIDGVLFNKEVTEMLCFPQCKKGNYTIPGTITIIPGFDGCNGLTSVTIPASLVSIGGGLDNCTNLKQIIVEEGNEYFRSIDGVLLNKEATWIICFPRGKSGAYTIPNSVTSVPSFAYCTGLTSITIPNSITYIQYGAFDGCDAIETVFYNTEAPCEINESTFPMSVYENATLYIPGGCLDTFKESSWKLFQNIKEFYVPVAKVGETTLSTDTTLESDEAVEVALTCETEGAEIYYLLTPANAAEPTAEAEYTRYTEPVKVEASSALSVYAKLNELKSEISTYNVKIYVIPAEPVAKVGETTLSSDDAFESNEAVEVALTCATEGAKIHYLLTADEAVEPAAEAEYVLYTEPVKVETSSTLRVYAELDGRSSAVVAYKIEIEYLAPAEPAAKVGETVLSTEAAFESDEAVEVALTCETEGAEIYYLLTPANAAEPTAEAEYTRYTEPVKVETTAKLSVYSENSRGLKSEVKTYDIDIKTNMVSMTMADLEDAEVYTLQGMRVVRPEAGQIYIVRKGGRAYKTIVK